MSLWVNYKPIFPGNLKFAALNPVFFIIFLYFLLHRNNANRQATPQIISKPDVLGFFPVQLAAQFPVHYSQYRFH